MLTDTKQKQHRVIAEGTKWKGNPACLRLPELEWPIKQDIIDRIRKQKRGPENRTPRSINFASKKHRLTHACRCTDVEMGFPREDGHRHQHGWLLREEASKIQLTSTGGGDFLWKQFQDAEHCKLGQLKTRSLINIMTKMLRHKPPSTTNPDRAENL